MKQAYHKRHGRGQPSAGARTAAALAKSCIFSVQHAFSIVSFR